MLAADFKGLQTPSDSEVDQMVRWINACSGCPHKNTRKDNMLRHVNTVHKGFAQISQYPANRLPVGVGDTGPSNMFFSNDVTLGFSTLRKQTKAKDPSTFFMGGIADVIKGVAEFQDNIRKIVAGDMNPAFRYQFGQVSTLPVTASKNATLVGAAASNPRIFLGFRAFICEKCHNIELVPSYLHSDPKIREGVSTHLCPNKVIPNNNQNSEIVRKLYDDVLTFMAWKFKEWAQEKVYVYAIPANEEPVTEQLNFVNFGKVSKNSFVYLAAKYGNSEILDPISLWGFVREAKATYCLCEFTHRGMKQRYFLYLYRVPKRSP